MAAERYTRTNQKIYFAGLALEALKKAECGQLDNAQAQAQACRETILFHLYGAVLGLCQEIAGYYKLPDTDAVDAFVWLNASAQAHDPMPERAELIELLNDKTSWLYALFNAYQALFQPLNEPKKAKMDPRIAVIEVTPVDDEQERLTSDKLDGWRQALKGQVLRFRESLTEC